ncbi:MAG: type I restriction enzyme HsdR N-terminal domain-containing protein, partial [Pseudomonadota bacterium]
MDQIIHKDDAIKPVKNLPVLLKDSDYKLTQFSVEKIDRFETRIYPKKLKGKIGLYTTCLIRKKEIKLTPEETIRQLYLMVLTEDLSYPENRIAVEYPVSFGREKKRADIVIFDKDKTNIAYIIVEIKKPKLKEGKEQLKSYCNASGAPIGVWSNGDQISYYHRKDPNYFEDIPAIPKGSQKLSDIIEERWF